jgi:hypothetical protein
MGQAEKQRILEQATKLYGRPAIAETLKVNAQLLDSWVDGRAPMPDRMLLHLADALVKLATRREK